MSDVMAQKLNSGFLMRPYSFFRSEGSSRPTRSETILRGWVYSMTRNEGHVCRFGYGAFAEKFGLSRSTVARTVRRLRGVGAISAQRKGGQNSVYTYVGDVSSASHIRTETWFFTERFNVGGAVRYLTNAEIDVLSLIYTHTRNVRTKRYEGSIREMAGILNISEKTVMRSISALFAADLIARPGIGVNGHQKSVFTANVKALRKIDKQVKKAEKEAAKQQEQLPAHVQAANAKAERERFYSIRRERSLQLEEHFKSQARKNPRFELNERERAKLNLQMAKAEIYEPLTLPALQARRAQLDAERARILDEQGVEEWQLDAKNHAICKLCFDTGHLPDGHGCSCYKASNDGAGGRIG